MPAPRHVYRIYIRASQERVWEAITDPEFTRRYFHGTAFESSLQPGTGFRYVMADGSDAVSGTIEVAEPPARLVMTWRSLYDTAMAAEPASRVEWLLEPAGDGMTRLIAVHGDLGASPATSANVGEGWAWILDSMKSLLETGEALPRETIESSTSSDELRADGQAHRREAIEADNTTWDLHGAAALDDAEAEDLVRSAYAAAYHWARAAGRRPENEARAEYLIAKSHWKLGRTEMAMHHATRCFDATTAAGLKDFDLAYAHEVMARALTLAGDVASAGEHAAAARAVPIDDAEDRALVESDLADL